MRQSSTEMRGCFKPVLSLWDKMYVCGDSSDVFLTCRCLSLAIHSCWKLAGPSWRGQQHCQGCSLSTSFLLFSFACASCQNWKSSGPWLFTSFPTLKCGFVLFFFRSKLWSLVAVVKATEKFQQCICFPVAALTRFLSYWCTKPAQIEQELPSTWSTECHNRL